MFRWSLGFHNSDVIGQEDTGKMGWIKGHSSGDSWVKLTEREFSLSTF